MIIISYNNIRKGPLKSRCREGRRCQYRRVERLRRLKRGEPVDPKLIYFRTMSKFETGAAKYRWLMESLFIDSAARHADRVVLDVHRVL